MLCLRDLRRILLLLMKAKSKTTIVYLYIILHNNLNTPNNKKSKITNKPALKQIIADKLCDINDNITRKPQSVKRFNIKKTKTQLISIFSYGITKRINIQKSAKIF